MNAYKSTTTTPTLRRLPQDSLVAMSVNLITMAVVNHIGSL